MVMRQVMEGWHTDPFGLHEARWMSAGRPTKLVADEGKESYDEAPSGDPLFKAVPYPPVSTAQDGVDLLRIDAQEASLKSALGRAAASILQHIHG
jgi:hypothetical protein